MNQLTVNNKQLGFTLVELVLVLLLIGVLASVAVPRLMTGSRFEDRLQADKLMGLLRQAQLRAMNDPQSVTVNDAPSRCSKIVITSTAFSIAQECKSGLLMDNIIKQEAEKGNFVGVNGLSISNSLKVDTGFILQFGQATTQNKHSGFLTEASLLGQPFIDNKQLENTLIITVGGKEVYIEPEGYIHGS